MLRIVAFSSLCLFVLATLAVADEKKVELKVGDKAPVFQAKDDAGKDWKSADHVGKKILVVYFYPADLTPGCTKQACGFRDDMKPLQDAGVEVVGVSGDSVENHKTFKEAKSLNFTLLADEDGAVAKAFGVPLKPGGTAKPKVDGKEYSLTRGVTAERWTFVIGPDGKIAASHKVKDAGADSKTVLDAVEKLKKAS